MEFSKYRELDERKILLNFYCYHILKENISLTLKIVESVFPISVGADISSLHKSIYIHRQLKT